jgi:hypothetical protein
MAGVASPMLRRSRSGAARFLGGLTAGGAVGGLLLSLPVFVVGTLLHSVLSLRERIVLLAVACVLLGVADLSRRTPHVQRQVPERLIGKVPPGLLGLAWGFDLGLLFTTQKTTSLIWVTIAAVLLLEPSWAAGVLIAVAVTASVTVAVRSLTVGIDVCEFKREIGWFGPVRRMSGVAILALLVVVGLQALQA